MFVIFYFYNSGFDAVVFTCNIFIGKRVLELRHVPKRSSIEFLRLCKVYFCSMKHKNRPLKVIFDRIRREWRTYKRNDGIWTLCGHVHGAWKVRGRNINVGVDVRGFAPMSSNEVLNAIDKEEK